MNLTDAVAKATDNGWSDDSRWTPSTVAAQVSTERNGFLGSVTVHLSGLVKWNVCSPDGTARSQRGQASDVDAALAACDNAITSASGTLF